MLCWYLLLKKNNSNETWKMDGFWKEWRCRIFSKIFSHSHLRYWKPGFFYRVYHTLLCSPLHLFLPKLAWVCKSVCSCILLKPTFEMFPLKCYIPPKIQQKSISFQSSAMHSTEQNIQSVWSAEIFIPEVHVYGMKNRLSYVAKSNMNIQQNQLVLN